MPPRLRQLVLLAACDPAARLMRNQRGLRGIYTADPLRCRRSEASWALKNAVLAAPRRVMQEQTTCFRRRACVPWPVFPIIPGSLDPSSWIALLTTSYPRQLQQKMLLPAAVGCIPA